MKTTPIRSAKGDFMRKLLCFILALTFSAPIFTLRKQITLPPSADVPPSTTLPDADEDDNVSLPPVLDEPTTPPQPPEEIKPIIKTDEYVVCTGSSVNLRSSPSASTSSNLVGVAAKNTKYSLVEKTGNWYAVYYKNKLAYLHADYAKTFSLEKSPEEKIEQVISVGYKLIGTKYVYGATRLHNGKGTLLKGFSVTAFDCSSLIQYMFYHGAGKLLDVTTRTQVVQGKFVARANLKRGDCIYFTNESRQHLTGINRVGHVAVYLGDNYILHTASDYARIEKITASRWKHYIESRRFT